MSDFREDLKKAIEKNTNRSEEAKENVWRRIDAEIKELEMKKRRNGAVWMAASVLLAGLVAFTAFTPVGNAAVSRIIAMFAPEKEVVTTVEGEEETAEQDLYIDAEAASEQVIVTENPEETSEEVTEGQVSYAMYVDTERYEVNKEANADIISPKDYPADYPPVDMQISQVPDISVEDMAASIYSELTAEYDNVLDIESAEFAHAGGLRLYAINGDLNGDKDNMPQWDDAVMKVYVLDNTAGGVFVVKMRYFIEAEEGHGARLEAMLSEFEIIPGN